eukprot:scaffold281_cov318-Pavlova_lutheri.AAC.51
MHAHVADASSAACATASVFFHAHWTLPAGKRTFHTRVPGVLLHHRSASNDAKDEAKDVHVRASSKRTRIVIDERGLRPGTPRPGKAIRRTETGPWPSRNR